MAERRFLGITVLGDFILNEGVDGILRNVERAGATAVACNPTVTAEAPEGTGSYQPPMDAGSSPRVFDRPLWGKKALWVRGGPSYHPDPELYRDSPYGPRQPNQLTDAHGAIIGEFIAAALERGLKVYLQIGAAEPSGLRDEDRPRLPDGRMPDRLADTASLASDAVRRYNRAYIHDLLRHYPDITGFRPDWPEYPCYKLDEAFQDFSPHVAAWAERNGFDFPRIRQAAADLYGHLHGGLSNDELRDFASPDRGKFSLLAGFRNHPGIWEWLGLKAALSLDMLSEWRDAITECAGPGKELAANAFMPPFSIVTGLNFAGAARVCDAIAPKLYTMHWSLMVKFWGETLLRHNTGLDETLVVRALVNLLDLEDEPGDRAISHYGYPDPDQPHPIPDAPQTRKIQQVVTEVAGRARVHALVHGYGPLHDFTRRLQLVARSPADGVWINRYGYLSDEKLDAIGRIWQ